MRTPRSVKLDVLQESWRFSPHRQRSRFYLNLGYVDMAFLLVREFFHRFRQGSRFLRKSSGEPNQAHRRPTESNCREY